jgi:hypothetical protein
MVSRVAWGLCMTFMGFVHNWSGLMAARVCSSTLSGAKISTNWPNSGFSVLQKPDYSQVSITTYHVGINGPSSVFELLSSFLPLQSQVLLVDVSYFQFHPATYNI